MGKDGAQRVISSCISPTVAEAPGRGVLPGLPSFLLSPRPGDPAFPSSLYLRGWGKADLVLGTPCRTLRRRARTGN